MKKKSIKKHFANIKKANYAGNQLLEHLKKNYVFLSDEDKQIDHLQQHLLNMNVLFSDMEKGMSSGD